AGLGCWSLRFLTQPAALWRGWQVLPPWTLLRTMAFGGIVAAGWLLACGLTYHYSIAKREGLLEEIRAVASRGGLTPEAIKGPWLFSVTLQPGQEEDPVGYLLQIRTGTEPGGLECRHLHWHHPLLPGLAFFSRHRLQPRREQFFFVSCLQGSKYGDPRP